jgi:hypothetical protein
MGFGSKWKAFFQDLELHAGLIPDYDSHIWLLHYLFLPAINQDSIDWANAWNSHSVSIRHERQRSPKDMFFFGMIQNGTRGLGGVTSISAEDEAVGDMASYGVDWDDLEDSRIRSHHDEMNAPDQMDQAILTPLSPTSHIPNISHMSKSSSWLVH